MGGGARLRRRGPVGRHDRRGGGARVVAIDVSTAARDLARRCGAEICLQALLEPPGPPPGPETAPETPTPVTSATSVIPVADVAGAVVAVTGGGAHVSLDALGSEATCANSLLSLRRRGRHVQVGLLPAALGRPRLPMDRVIAAELEILGSHGMPAHAYPRLLALIAAGALDPGLLVTQALSLDAAAAALASMDRLPQPGIRLIEPQAVSLAAGQAVRN
jgi:alcohol dehydrogenase